MQNTRILLAEGNPERFGQVRSLLEGLGYEVVPEPAGPEDLLDQVVRHAPHLVLVSESRKRASIDPCMRAALQEGFTTPVLAVELGDDGAGRPAGPEDRGQPCAAGARPVSTLELWRALESALPGNADEPDVPSPPIGEVSARSDAVVLMDEQGRVTYWGPSAGRMFGHAAQEALGRPLQELMAPRGEREPCEDRIGDLCRIGSGSAPAQPLDLIGVHRDGRLLRVRLRVMALRVEERRSLLGVLRDLSLSRQVERELEESRLAFQTVMERNLDGILILDGEGVVQYLNQAAADLFGRSREAFLGEPFRIPRVTGESMEVQLPREGGEVLTGELRVGRIPWHGLDATLVMIREFTRSGKQEEGPGEGAGERKIVSRRLEILPDSDPLTDLLNRRGLTRALDREMNRGRRQGAMPSVIYVDLDDFRRVNERLGHQAGNVVLREVSLRIRRSARGTDCVARVGGDQFLVMLPETRHAEAVLVAERIGRSVRGAPVPVAGADVHVTASMGVVSLPYESRSLDDVLSLARRPLRASKRAGKNLISLDPRLSDPAGEPGDDGGEILRGLIQGRGLYAVAQPILRLSDERVVAHELFSRSRFQVLEMPEDFFQYSRENQMLPQMDLSCLRLCLEASHRLSGVPRCHVNLFPYTLLTADLDSLVRQFPQEAGDPRFCVEINEQQVVGDPGPLRGAVRALREQGIQVAIDDVGFGRSSLESMVLLSPDILKIDRRFVSGVAWSPGKRNALDRLFKVGRALGAEVIAAGVETREDFRALREMGIEYGQGFLWSRPEEVP